MRLLSIVLLAVVLTVGVMGFATLAAQESKGDKTAGQVAEADSNVVSGEQSDTTVVSEPEADSPVVAVPPGVRELLDTHCVRCHGGGRPAKGYDLSTDDQVLSHMGAAAAQMKNVALIDPGHPETSYLIMKVKNSDGIAGNRMPVGGSALSPEEIAVLADWISGMARPEAETASAEVDTTKPETKAPDVVTPDTTQPSKK
ncbi:MAG: hypothetical protein JXB46_09450 [Candidatus Eisenbacteria bacterium]|nr:hypothetical protein [Candidatus Eisenbacteria bacterium]